MVRTYRASVCAVLLFGVVSIVRLVIGPSSISRAIPRIHIRLLIVGAAVECLNSAIERSSCSVSNLLNAANKHVSDETITPFCIKHYVIQVALWPVQLKVSLDEGCAISVNSVSVRYCLFLGCSGSDQSVNLRRARSIEERPKHILAIAKKIFRAPANNYAWAARKRVIDRLFGNGSDPARIKDCQPICWLRRDGFRYSLREVECLVCSQAS